MFRPLMLVFSPDIYKSSVFISLNISMFLIRDLRHPPVRGTGPAASAGGLGAGRLGGGRGARGELRGERHAASQPSPGQD